MAIGTGFSIHVYTPRISGKRFIETIENISGYGHTINAIGGFESADFAFPVTVEKFSEWYESGLMREIEVFDESGILVFEGYVNSMSLQYAARKIEIGPATDIANRVAIVYTPIYTGSTTQPPAKGGQTVTAAANHSRSQSIYGIFYKTVNAGECTDADALAVRDSYLAEMAYPQKNETLNTGDRGETRVGLKISGYSSMLAISPYSNASPAAITYSAFIPLLLAADPNSYFSTSTAKIVSNLATMSRFQDGTRNIFDIIKSICSLGDVSDNRWIFGVYEGRTAYYSAVPTSPEYGYRLSQGSGSLVIYPGTDIVRPWMVRPGKWLKYSDFPIRERLLSGNDIRSDPQSVFIESVSFREPFSLTINGGRVSTVSQKLARLGLGSR